jgi:hypothetical protein
MQIYASNSGTYYYKLQCHFLLPEYSTVLISYDTEHKSLSVIRCVRVCVSSKLTQVVRLLACVWEVARTILIEVFHCFPQSFLTISG